MIKQLLTIFSFVCLHSIAFAQISPPVEYEGTNFEANASLAVIDSSATNIWQIGAPQKTFFGISHSAPYAIMTDTVNSYPVNNHSTFTISKDSCIQMEFFPSAYIAFWHKYETDSLKDGGYVEFSSDSGHTWMNVIVPLDSVPWDCFVLPQNFYTEADTLPGNIPSFTGTKNTWQYSKILLAWNIATIGINPHTGIHRDFPFVNKIMFRFNFKSDSIQTNKAGWIIDDVEIGYEDVGGGVTENKAHTFDVKQFPNPMGEQSIIQVIDSGDDKNFALKLYNATGQLISESAIDHNNQFIIQKKNLDSGIYFYSVTSAQGHVKTGKIVVN